MSDYVIAKYIRLSRDDAASESMSIPHQRLILDKHISELDIPNARVLEFVDNGYTGTNLERPGAQEMLELVRCGRINCIVTKDFSRFSRNAMESGYYIEQVFPLYRIRFIALGESFDSNDYPNDTGGIDVAFRYFMHEYYSKDLSIKVKTAVRSRMERGEHIVAGAIYGYRKNDSKKWEEDPEPAAVVRLIFKMALDGLNTAQIRDKLFIAKYPTPKEHSDIKHGKAVVPKYMWAAKQILRILKNEQYIGSYVAGKNESTRIGGKSLIEHDRSKWIILPDSHPAIISKEDFATVQKMLANPKELAPVKSVPSNHSCASRVRIASGERKSSAVPYGYVKDSNGEWRIDEPAAKVVRDIYDLTLQGLSIREIIDRLCKAELPTPAEYTNLAKGMDIQPTYLWPSLRICDILKNEQYIGTYVAGKIYQDTNGRKYHAPKSEWIIFPDKHPAIISKEVFARVQEIRSKSRKTMRKREYLLRGKIICGCCGFAMIYSDSNIPASYRCTKTHADPMADCHKMKVCAPDLEQSVMAIIKKKADELLESGNPSELHIPTDLGRRISEYEIQIRQMVEQRQRNYEQFVQGIIDRNTYMETKEECATHINRLNNQLSILQQAEHNNAEHKKATALANGALNASATPQDIVDALIEKVYYFPENRIKIKWKFGV